MMGAGSDKTQSEAAAYELGRQAFAKGASSDTNPFQDDERLRDKWEQGFTDGQKIRSDDRRP